ncbi:MAG: recombination mediator RecR [Candidatus Kerfeldbacteria bacterium]
MSQYPEPINNLIEKLSRWPGLGPKAAERVVFYLMKQNPDSIKLLLNNIAELKNLVKICNYCFNVSTQNPCQICEDKTRDNKLLCIVSEPQDILVIEKTGDYNGSYHVLGGVINPAHNITPDQLKIKELVNRIKNNGYQEIIIATNPDLEGESTAMYITQQLKPLKIKITKLAKGLPIGSTIEYADEITIASALKGRQEV